jgi:predicted HicB family RNase H-like nuclease
MARRPMDEGKKTEQRGKSVLDWTEERARTFPLRLSHKSHQILKEHATKAKQSLHEYIMQAIWERIERDVT